ncbi:MAG: ABC transporter substrate-binding protein [Bacillati bacterium ANGP1]|uniref:ABC transporter substrate-binding protein n=1 Tax=Candidatus Segetimicrobium genomatis TaxID=2569760 RepID=A0A537JCZ4_9BACT|nr:MAG: ABC transporter substrate-binding protein [Terrabacteria group bacterium ANGP1]
MTVRGNSQDTRTPIRVTRSGRGFTVAVAIGALLVTLISGLGSPPGWAAGPASLVWGRSGDVFTLDIPLSTDTQSTMVSTQLYNTLTRAKPGQVEIEPDLATSWSTTPDALVWTFKLRQGVTFHDGSAFNAEAVKFNIDRWADPNNPYRPKGGTFEAWDDFVADTYKESRVVDPETVQIVLKTPNAPLLSALSAISFGFASPQSIKQYGGEGVTQHPVGTGPFRFVEWARDDHITLDANTAYFRRGFPRVQRVVFRVIKDNAARFLALKAGEVQLMELPNPDDVRAAQRDPNLSVGLRPAFNSGWLRFNMNLPLFQDRRIRQAVAVAINRQAIVQGLYAGYGQVADQLLPPVMWGRSPNVKSHPFDPARARQLLAEAGYPNGVAFDFWYMPISRTYFPNGKTIATAIASDLAKVGIRVQLKTEDWAAYLKDRATGKFPVFMIGGTGDYGDPDDFWAYNFAKYDPISANFSYNKPQLFSLIAKARTVTSQTDRAMLYAQAAEMIDQDVRDIYIAHARNPVLMRRNVDGLALQPTANEYVETVGLK